MVKYIKLKQGFTLVEVLTSIILIGFILTIFLSLFSQSMVFSSKNSNQLDALTIAREVLASIQQGQSVDTEYVRGNVSYFVEVKDLTPSLSEASDLTDPSKPPFGLYMKQVNVYSSESMTSETLLAKTYGYIK